MINTYKIPTLPNTDEYIIILEIAHFIPSINVLPNA